MAGENVNKHGLTPAVAAWQTLLRTDKDQAKRLVWSALQRMDETGLFHRTEIATAYSRMMNGTACPSDYCDGGSTVACA